MKKFTAVLAAAILMFSCSVTAFAVPEESAGGQQSQASIQQNSDAASSAPETSAPPKQELSQETGDTPEQSSKIQSVTLDSIGMHIDLPSNLNVLTRETPEGDPAFSASHLTKAELDKSFAETDTYLKAFSEDFSFDITVTLKQNERTKAIGNLTTLADKEVENVIEGLLENDMTTGCSRATFNNTLFLLISMEYNSDATKVYAVQYYTVIKETNVMITFQSANRELTDADRELAVSVMQSVIFDGVGTVPAVQNVGNAQIGTLDLRYLLLMITSIVSVALLAAIIIVAIKRHQTVADELEAAERERQKPKPSNAVLLPAEETGSQEQITSMSDTSLFTPVDEEVIYKDQKAEEKRQLREQTRVIPKLDATAELSIPENPYTPVGKAEAVQQPAMSVTSEIAKFSTITAEAKRLAEEQSKETPPSEGTVVFAESTPKPKTEIEQIGESVLSAQKADEPEQTDDPQTEQPLSEYEKRFGKNRTVPSVITDSASSIVPVDEDERRQSKFEKHFGTPTPAAVQATAQDDTVTAVEQLFPGEDTQEEAKSPIPTFKPRTEAPTEAAPDLSNTAELNAHLAAFDGSAPAVEASSEAAAATESEAPKSGFFSRFTRSLFETDEDEPDSTLVPEEVTDENSSSTAAMESKNKFLRSIEEKLGQAPAEQTAEEPAVVSEQSKAAVTEQPEAEAKEADPAQQDEGVEIYTAPKTPHYELAFKKDENGELVIDSVSDENGNPVKVQVKDGTAQLQAAAEKARAAEQEQEPSAYDRRFGKTAPSDVTTEEIPTAETKQTTEPEDAALSPFEKKFGKASADTAAAAALTAAGLTAGAVADAAAPVPSAAAKEIPKSEEAAPEQKLPEPAPLPEESTSEPTDNNKDATNEIPEEPPKETTEVIPTESDAKDNIDEGEKKEMDPVMTQAAPRPGFIFERDAGIIFEHGTAAAVIAPTETGFTLIPRLDSVNAEDYNRHFEELRNAAKKEARVWSAEPSAPAVKQPAAPAAGTETIEFYTGYDDTEDPFAPGAGEHPSEETKPGTSFGARLRKSFSKLFSSAEDEN